MEIDPGIIEASIAMGLSTKEIIFDVYLRENIPGMIRGLTISFIALVGQIAIVGSVGAGGLGDMAIEIWSTEINGRYHIRRYYLNSYFNFNCSGNW